MAITSEKSKSELDEGFIDILYLESIWVALVDIHGGGVFMVARFLSLSDRERMTHFLSLFSLPPQME